MKRIAALLHELKNRKVDGFFTSSVSNITYLTGFSGDSSRLFVSFNRCVLITDGRYTEQARLECPSDVEVFKWIDNKRYDSQTYRHIINIPDIHVLGVEENVLTYSEYNTLRYSLTDVSLKDIDGITENIRQQKDEQEIGYLRTACVISDKALEQTIPFIKAGITELELAARLEFNLKTNGAENLSFDTLLLSGARTSLLHGKPSGKKLEVGDLVLFDFGALYKGYHADISRTFVLGKADGQQKEVYNIIKDAQMNAIKSLKANISSQAISQMVVNAIPGKFIDYYYPGLGHGVGLQIHEEPFLGQTYADRSLLKNTTLTIEPGIYIPEWGGIRIEDTVLVTDNGAESLSDFQRELMEL
jgi:Xaa-Pro aminopeptidase